MLTQTTSATPSATPAPAQPTPPANLPGDPKAAWLLGFTAGQGLAAKPATPTPTPVITVGVTPNVSPGADLVDLLAHAKAGQQFVLGKGTYPLKSTAVVAAVAKGVVLDGNGATITAGAANADAFRVQGDDFEFFGATCTASVPGVTFLRAFGKNLKAHGCWVTGVRDFILLDRNTDASGKDAGGSDGAIISGCNGQGIDGDFIYCTSDNVQIISTGDPSSAHEHCIRFSPHANGHIPSTAFVSGCTLGNANGKETLAARQVQNLAVLNCTFHGWTLAGENIGAKAGSNVTVSYTDCVWPDLYPAGAQMNIAQGVIATLLDCRFANDAKQVSIVINGNSQATLTGTVRKRTAKGAILRPTLWMPSPNMTPAVVESGTVIIDAD